MKNPALKLLTKGQIIPHLEESISKAADSIFLVGPWLDAYFTRLMVNSLVNEDVEVKFVVRMDEGVVDGKTLSALNLAHQKLGNFQARSLENLHSKVILIDREIFFLGSANWYWYSLNQGVEVVIKGYADQLTGLVLELDKYWSEGSPIPVEELKHYKDFTDIEKMSKSRELTNQW